MRDHLEKFQQRKLGLRFFLPAGDNRTSRSGSSSARPATSTPSPTRSTGAVRERAVPARSEPAPTRSVAGASRTSSSAPTSAPVRSCPGGRDGSRHGALDRRRYRPRQHPAAQARDWRRVDTGHHSTPRGSGSRAGWTSRTGADDEEWLGRMPGAGPAEFTRPPT